MTFGSDLHGQIPSILNYVGDGIQSVTQFRNFIRDRSSIEREYAQKLDNLARKYKSSGQSIKKQGETPTDGSAQQDEWDWEDTSSTTSSTWCQLINQTSSVAKSRFRLVDDLNNVVVDSLKSVAVRKEDSRKKHAAFFQKLRSERDKTYADKDKAKQLYDEACMEIENLKTKLGKSSGDQEKLQRHLDAALLDRDNKKNLYLLSIGIANAERSKYFEEDVPILADHLQELDASRILSLKAILKKYIDLESNLLTTAQKYHDDTLTSIEKLDPAVDAGVFVRSALGVIDTHEKAANVTFTFIPWNGGAHAAETIIDRDDSLVSSDSAVIFLNNKLIKDRKQLDVLGDELSKKSAELNELESTVNSIENKTSGKYDKSKEKMMDLIREIATLSTQKVRVKSEVDLIIQNIGDDGLRAQNHDFKASSFTIPTTCDFCNSTIWGLSNKGFTCKACGFNCHAKCEMKVAPNCSKIKGQLNPQPAASTLQPARTRSVRSSSYNGSIDSVPTSRPPTTTDTLSNNTPHPFSNSAYANADVTGATADMRSIYSYDAQNSDELSIAEGDLLKIVEPDDGTGWIKAQLGNQVGLIPANYIEYLEQEDPHTKIKETEDVYSQCTHPNTTDQHNPSMPSAPALPTPEISSEEPPMRESVVALYDFEAVNSEELNIHQGDIIVVTKKDDSGWWEGTLNGKTGIFPSNYVSS